MKKIITTILLSLVTLVLPMQKGEASWVSSDYFKLGYKQLNALHIINSISSNRNCVEFTDGSTWETLSYDVRGWQSGDVILVTQNDSIFSSSPRYELQDLTADKTSPARLMLGPVRNNPNTHIIEAINYDTKQILLENGSLWDISYSNSSIFDKWLAGDLVILGTNAEHYYSAYSYILINTNSNLNEFVKAKMN